MRGGLDLLDALRSEPRYATLPFILLSLFGAEHDTADREHRPDAVGLKPIRAALLNTLVDQVLTGKMPTRAGGQVRDRRRRPPSAATRSCWWRTIR